MADKQKAKLPFNQSKTARDQIESNQEQTSSKTTFFSIVAESVLKYLNNLRMKQLDLINIKQFSLEIQEFLQSQKQTCRLIQSDGLVKAARDILIKLSGMGVVVNASLSGQFAQQAVSKYMKDVPKEIDFFSE